MRQKYILDYLAREGVALVPVLCDTFRVSHDTVLRDLRELSNQGLLTRIHGGALADKPDLPWSNCPAKIIAGKLAPLLSDNSFLLACGGDALLELYTLIPSTFRATLLTVNMQLACRYSDHPKIDVIQIGDRVLKTSKMAAGGEAITKIRQIKADMCILDVTAIDPDRGLTENDWQVAQVKTAMAESSDKIVCFATSHTLGRISPIQAFGPSRISYLITDLDSADQTLNDYRNRGIVVL